MRFPAAVLLSVVLTLSGCASSWSSEQRPRVWKTAFWLWGGRGFPAASSGPVDSLYVQAGNITDRVIYAQLPADLPAAREYWIVFRYDRRAIPALETARELAGEIGNILAKARLRGLPVAGVQLDIDSPTAALPQYAAFLRDLKQNLPSGPALSITALLDWFRPGAAIADVIRETDEFVPQFYDTGASPGSAIAAPIDAAQWGPVFNRFRKPFRIGVSTFGRSRKLGATGHYFFGDLLPIHIATNPAFQLRATRNPAHELVLAYTAARSATVGYNDFDPGDAIEFIVSTPETVRAAVDAVRRMDGFVGGVIFFRWPASGETLTLQPSEVLAAAGLGSPAQPPRDRIQVVDAQCAAVSCVDLYFESSRPLSPESLRRRVTASAALDYFLPEKGIPVRMSGPAALDLSLPPYCARGRLYLGRAVSEKAVEFRIEDLP